MVNAILAKRVNHIVTKGDNPAWPKGSKSRGFSSSAFPKETPVIPPPLNYEIKFEEQFEICSDKSQFPLSPNIDVVISTPLSDIAIESKFTEPYGNRKHEGLKQKYVENISFWDGLPNLYELAKEISPDDTKFQYLDAAQLIKHILGLKNSCDKYNFQIKPGLNGRRLFRDIQ